MKTFEVVGLPPDEINAFLSATHSDPFRVLGPHRVGDDLAIRVFRPDAEKIEVVLDRQSNGQVPAEKIHRDGFFCARVPGATRDLDYHLRLTTRDGSQQVMRDPYGYEWALFSRATSTAKRAKHRRLTRLVSFRARWRIRLGR